MKKPESLYKCSMVVLYTVCRFGWTLYGRYQERFAGFSDEYTKQFGLDALAAVNKAQQMPDVSQRRATVSGQGVELDDSSAAGLLFWKKLRRYICKAVPGSIAQAAAIAEAGGAHFAKAAEGNWSEIGELLTAGQTYLQSNVALLIDKAKMPADFEADYNKAKQTFDNEHIGYGAAKSDATEGTVDKIAANNTLYGNLQFMFRDAQVVFEDQKSIARQFSFAAVKRLVTKDMAGIHFTVTDPATDKPVPSATITTDESTEVFDVNNRGVATILMKVGIHSITVAAPGFENYTGVVKVDAGVKHRVKIKMQKQIVPHEIAEVAFTNETALEQ